MLESLSLRLRNWDEFKGCSLCFSVCAGRTPSRVGGNLSSFELFSWPDWSRRFAIFRFEFDSSEGEDVIIKFYLLKLFIGEFFVF